MRCGAGRVDRSAMGRSARRPNGSALGGGRRRRRSGGPVRAHGFVPSTVSAVRAAPCRRRCPRSSAIRAHHDAGKREGAHGHARAVKRWPSSRGHVRLRRARAGFGPRAGLRAGPEKRAAPAPCASVGALDASGATGPPLPPITAGDRGGSRRSPRPGRPHAPARDAGPSRSRPAARGRDLRGRLADRSAVSTRATTRPPPPSGTPRRTIVGRGFDWTERRRAAAARAGPRERFGPRWTRADPRAVGGPLGPRS